MWFLWEWVKNFRLCHCPDVREKILEEGYYTRHVTDAVHIAESKGYGANSSCLVTAAIAQTVELELRNKRTRMAFFEAPRSYCDKLSVLDKVRVGWLGLLKGEIHCIQWRHVARNQHTVPLSLLLWMWLWLRKSWQIFPLSLSERWIFHFLFDLRRPCVIEWAW
jgi:hypothetical protein